MHIWNLFQTNRLKTDVVETELVEWLTMNYKKYGCKLELVTQKSQEGTQFYRGFGGIGGLLQYQVDLMTLQDQVECTDQDDINNFEDNFI